HVDAAEARHARGGSSPPTPARRFTARWHLAWSERYVARKYRLAGPRQVSIVENAFKAIGYGLILNRMKMFAHAGSFAGARAFARGESALARQGLEEPK